MAGVIAMWVAAGVLAFVLHRPWSVMPVVAIAIPWVVGLVLFSRRATFERLARAWREALGEPAATFGVTALIALVAFATFAVNIAGALLLALWLAAALSAVGTLKGAGVLRSQLIGWSLLALSTATVLFAAEALLHWGPVAQRLGTPPEIRAWRERYDRVWERNVLGIRSPYETIARTPGSLRIVALGDSFTWGDKIASTDSTWPAQLERQLRHERAGARLEVVNLARNGFTMVNSAEMLRRLGWQFQPDIVLVQFYLNDILPSGPEFMRHYRGWIFPDVWLLPPRYRNSRLGDSSLLQVVESSLSALRHGDRTARIEAWTALYQARGKEWDDLAGALEEMGRAAVERDVPIVLLLFPDLVPGSHTEADVPFRAIHDQVTRTARSAGFAVLDLTPHFLRAGGDLRQWWATPYDAHPNEAAARLAASAVAEYLLPGLPDASR